jgi:hypothetical protein
MSGLTDSVRGKALETQCPHCGEWNDWGGDIESREIDCGHCRRTCQLSDEPEIVEVKK